VIEIHSRSVEVAGVRIAPDGDWMRQIGRNLLDPVDGFLGNATHLIHDRDPVFTAAWSALLETHGIECVAIPAQSPNCNPHAERFVKSVRTECLDHFVIFGERHLRYLLKEFVGHYLNERYHQALGSQIIRPMASPSNDNAALGAVRWSRLGGALNYYYRTAA
jgi:putative transposase